MLLSGNYDIFKAGNAETSMYKELYTASTDGLSGIYHIVMQIGVYSAAIAVLLAGILFVYVKSNPQELVEAKKRLIKIGIVVTVLFSIVSLISFVVGLGAG